LTEKTLQVLRTIDKADRIGIPATVDLLQQPIAAFGADLDPIQASLIGLFLDTKEKDGDDPIGHMRAFFSGAARVMARVDMMAFLDQQPPDADGKTALDRLLAIPQNDDETWNAGGRPKNIAWALDDLVRAMTDRRLL